MRKEKKEIKINLSIFFLIISIAIIVVMGIFIYKLNNNKSTELQAQVNDFSELLQNIYPNSTGNFSRSYYGSINIDFKYDGNESVIEVTINENNFGENIGKTKLMFENNNLKEKVVDVSIDYSIYHEGIYTITILTENGNACVVPWLYTYGNTANLIKAGENILRLGDGGGFDLSGNQVFYNDFVYVDGE